MLGGFAFLGLDEQLTASADSALLTSMAFTDDLGNVLVNAAPGSTISVFDRFETRNQFYGGQIGGCNTRSIASS